MQYQIMQTMPEGAEQTEQTVQAMFPAEAMAGSYKDGQGRIFKMHIRDHNGHYRTIHFDYNRHMMETDDGNC